MEFVILFDYEGPKTFVLNESGVMVIYLGVKRCQRTHLSVYTPVGIYRRGIWAHNL